MHRITSVSIFEDYSLLVEFDDGVSGVVDLSSLVGKGVFKLFHDKSFFQQVRIGSSGELVWGDQIDLCPDSLYMKLTGREPEEVFPVLKRESARA